MDVLGLVRKKLTAAGFEVVTDPKKSHAATVPMTMNVHYVEEQGKQYRFDMYGTVITCKVRLEDAERGPLLNLDIRESSGEQYLGTPPYIEAMQKFETNPYLYFLGDLVKGRAVTGRDETEVLTEGLTRLTAAGSPRSDPLSAPHTMLDSETTYPTQARDNTIEELGRLKDDRAVPVLLTLLENPDVHVRRLAVTALGSIGSAKAGPSLEQVARADQDQAVRLAAREALERLGHTPDH